MGLKCGIVGLPNVGKSTLFNSLSSAKAQSANFPFCTIEPNVGTISIPDPRLYKLADMVKPQNIVPNTIEIYDIAGLVKGASEGEGLGNQFLANIRDVNAILHVVRCFEDDNVVHVDGRVDPVSDKEIIDTELQLKDLDTVEKRLQKLEKQSKSGDKKVLHQQELFRSLKDHLQQGKSARSWEAREEDEVLLNELQLLTRKPVLYVANVEEDALESGNHHVEKLREAIQEEQAGILLISAKIESELAEIEEPDERQDLLAMYGLEEPGVNRLIRAAYKLLDLQTYFTAGEKEVRAWPVPVGATAPEAAGVIHTDFQKGFIKAEVIGYDDYVHYQSEAAARDAGRVRIEGKQYIVQDGDVMHFRFNV